MSYMHQMDRLKKWGIHKATSMAVTLGTFKNSRGVDDDTIYLPIKPTIERMPSLLKWLLPGMLFILNKKGWEGYKLLKVMKRTCNWPFKMKTSASSYILLSMLITKIYLGSDVKIPTQIPKDRLQKRSILYVDIKHLFRHQYPGFSY